MRMIASDEPVTRCHSRARVGGDDWSAGLYVCVTIITTSACYGRIAARKALHVSIARGGHLPLTASVDA